MSKINTSTSIAAGFIGGIVFLAGCGSESVNNAIAAAESLWGNVGTTIFYTDGNVGIGTNTPTAKLHIKGKPTAGGELKFESGDGLSGGNISVSNSEPLRLWTAGTEKVRIDSAGNVGIGVTSPKSKLSVSGLPTSAPDNSGFAGIICVTNDGNFWLAIFPDACSK